MKGSVVTDFLPLIDNFDLAGKQLKLETEGEKKVNAAYQVRTFGARHRCPACQTRTAGLDALLTWYIWHEAFLPSFPFSALS